MADEGKEGKQIQEFSESGANRVVKSNGCVKASFVVILTAIVFVLILHQSPRPPARDHMTPPTIIWLRAATPAEPSTAPPFRPPEKFVYRPSPNPGFIWNNKSMCAKVTRDSKAIAVLVITARKNFGPRDIIRKTWGSIRHHGGWSLGAVAFILGTPRPEEAEEHPSMVDRLESERILHGDLIMGDFVDAYKNLTLKMIKAYDWVAEFCPHAKIVIKADDDVFINLFQLARVLNEDEATMMDTPNYHCFAFAHRPVDRDPLKPYFVDRSLYPSNIYPPFCAGSVYLTSISTVIKIRDILRTFRRDKLLWIEDTLFTGIARVMYNHRVIRQYKVDRARTNSSNHGGIGSSAAVAMDTNNNGNGVVDYRTIELVNKTDSWFFWQKGKVYKMVDLRKWLNVTTPLEQQEGERGSDSLFNETELFLPNGWNWYYKRVEKEREISMLNRIFYIIERTESFDTDFSTLWKKIKHIEGLL